MNFSRGATPAFTIRSVMASATLIRAWQWRAAYHSHQRNRLRAAGALIGMERRAVDGVNDRRHAQRPTPPAGPGSRPLALCVCTTSGLNSRMARFRAK